MLITALLATAAVLPARAARPAEGSPVATLRNNCAASEPGVRINVSGLKDRSGRLKLELYPATTDDFLGDSNELLKAGKVFRRVITAVPAGGIISMCVSVPKPGRYAVVVIHKRNGSARFSIVNDGVGLAGTDRIGRHRPSYEQALVIVADQVTKVAIRMQYLHGLAGFRPETP